MTFNLTVSRLLRLVVLACAMAGGQAGQPQPAKATLPDTPASSPRDFITMPGGTNAVQLRLYTNASQEAHGLFNSIELEAYGQRLLQSPGGESVQRWLAASTNNAALHQILINRHGPALAHTNHMKVVEEASGPQWRYLALDATAAYRDRVEQYRRAILFVEPDLFVLYDQIVAKAPSHFQIFLHPPAATSVDDIWRDLRLELPKAGFRIHAPGTKGMLRSWQRVTSPADTLLPGTVTMELGPTNKLARLDLITVLAVSRGGENRDYAFKLLESNTAVGARIHREGWPTLVAFRTDPANLSSSLTGFGFNGPVGVDVFRPKHR
jgi:hypothetical protein